VIDSIVPTTNHEYGSENQIDKNNDSEKKSTTQSNNKPMSDEEETLHLQNVTNPRYDTTEKQFKTPENYKAEASS